MKKRILTILLSLAMIVSLMPMTAYADEEEPTPVPTENTVEEYPVWVGGVQFTSKNLEIDSTDTTAITNGSAELTIGEDENGYPIFTLTLSNFTYNGKGYDTGEDNNYGKDYYAAITAYYNLNIVLEGENSITVEASEDELAIGIFTGDDNLKINGSLTNIANYSGEACDLTINSSYDGTKANNITIENCSINATSNIAESSGIGARGSISINNAVVVSDACFGGLAAPTVNISGSDVTTTGDMAGIVNIFYFGTLSTNITNSKVIATGGIEGIFSYGNITISGESEVTAIGGSTAFNPAPTLNGTFAIYAGDNAENAEGVASIADNYNKNYVKIIPLIEYPVWVGGEQFTSAKLTIDGNDDNDETVDDGTATFNPSTNTLTLNNFNGKGDGYKDSSGNHAFVYSSGDLIIKLTGENTVGFTASSGEAIYVDGNLTITDDTADKADSKLYVISNTDSAILVKENLTIRNIAVDSDGQVMSEGEVLLISNAIVNSNTTNNKGIYGYGCDVTIENSDVTAKSENGIGVFVYTGELGIANSTLEAAGGDKAIYVSPTFKDGETSDYNIYAGDAAPGEIVPEPTDETFTNSKYVKIEPKPAPTYTAPSAVSGLVYNGSNQTLITAGSATNGTMQYALGVNGTTAPSEGWTADLPTAKNAGTYYVWYKVIGAQGYTDITPKFAAAVTVSNAEPTPTPDPYIPTVTIQKPVITTDAGSAAGLSILGNTATITVAEGYELVDVTVNGVSKGAVTTLSGLKTGDTVVVTTKPIEPVKTESELIQEKIDGMKLVARSKRITAPSGKKSIMIYWYDKSGAEVEFDGVEIFRSTDMNSGFEKVFVSKTDQYYNTAIEAGTKYYYKVRGYVEVDGKKIYTDWSLKAFRAAK